MSESLKIISCIAYPLIGAGIGYVANRVAFSLLFRPLKPWRILGMRLPFTPGVIPAKRHALALAIGEMAGEQLLTGTEVGEALNKQQFQDHLLTVIRERVGSMFSRELGPVAELVPENFRSYFDVATKAVIYHVRKSVHVFIRSDEFSKNVEQHIDSICQWFLESEAGALLSVHECETVYACIEGGVDRMLAGPAMDKWVEQFVHQQVRDMLQSGKSLYDIMPASTRELIMQAMEDQTPVLLGSCADFMQEPLIRDAIVRAARNCIDDLIRAQGVVSSMVGGFLDQDRVEAKIGQYLIDKKEDIAALMRMETVRERAAERVREQCLIFLKTPLVRLLHDDKDSGLADICAPLSRLILILLRRRDTSQAISLMIRANIETYIDGGRIPVRKVMHDLFGERGMTRLKAWMVNEGLALLRSQETAKTIDAAVETMTCRLLARRIGRLSDLLPAGVRDGIYLSIRKMALAMLASEVPGLAHSLNIKTIVTEKVDALDLLSLEQRLLSIMGRQLSSLSLLGALIGFAVGCANLLFI
ncbi:MAG: DUF445 family protein [Desulfocapsaceae bacterium]|nr:DUF445 family protein [Desulfocapsaceae bacterium]